MLLLAVIMINTSGCTQGNSDSSGDDITAIETNQEQQQDTVKVGNDGVNAAIAPDDVSIVADQAAKNNAMVAMSVEDMGRSDPFLPEGEKVVVKPKPKNRHMQII